MLFLTAGKTENQLFAEAMKKILKEFETPSTSNEPVPSTSKGPTCQIQPTSNEPIPSTSRGLAQMQTTSTEPVPSTSKGPSQNQDPLNPTDFLEVQNDRDSVNLLGFPDNWPYEALANTSEQTPNSGLNQEMVTVSVPVLEVDQDTFNAFKDSNYNKFLALSNNLTGVESSTTCPDDFTSKLFEDPFKDFNLEQFLNDL